MTNEELELEKLRIKRNREKFWVGTVLIGLISLFINSSIQSNRLEHERIKQDNEHLSKFVTYAISKDLEVRRDIAEYFAIMSSTKESQERWGNYLSSVDKLVELKYSLLNDIELNKYDRDKLYLQLSEAKLALLNDPENSRLRNKILTLTNEIDGKQTLIQEKTKELKKIQPSVPDELDKVKPDWLKIAEIELNKNIHELSGENHNTEILKYSSDLGIDFVDSDEIPWSAQFINWCLEESGIQGTGKTNNRSFMNWGIPLDKPRPGCVVVFWRESKDSWKGHAGFYVKDDNDKVLILGGNQDNSVNISSYSKDKILGYRWPSN